MDVLNIDKSLMPKPEVVEEVGEVEIMYQITVIAFPPLLRAETSC
jgi:hypothetical protein